MSDMPVCYDIAALYVERGGAYWGLPSVECWDEQRDARLRIQML
jgi:hypothetical protein